MGRYCKPLEVYLHRNSSDLPFVIAKLARLSKHSERLINPFRFLAQKDIRPMITTLPVHVRCSCTTMSCVYYCTAYYMVGLARSRSSTLLDLDLASVFPYTVLCTCVPYVAYRYSCEAVWCTVRTRTASVATCTAVWVP